MLQKLFNRCPEDVEYTISAHGDKGPNDSSKNIVNSDMKQIQT